MGEVDPAVAARFDLTRAAAGGTVPRRVGWLEVDLGILFDEEKVPRRVIVGGAVSRFPSSDIDLAFVVEDRHPADAVADALRRAGGSLLESVHLFDVYRGPGIGEGFRSLAYRLRFCADDRTLTDEEVGVLRPVHRRRGRRVSAPLYAERASPWRCDPLQACLIVAGRVRSDPVDPLPAFSAKSLARADGSRPAVRSLNVVYSSSKVRYTASTGKLLAKKQRSTPKAPRA